MNKDRVQVEMLLKKGDGLEYDLVATKTVEITNEFMNNLDDVQKQWHIYNAFNELLKELKNK